MNTWQESTSSETKVSLVDKGVGKSSILMAFANPEDDRDIQPSLGLEFYDKSVTVDNTTIKLQCCDTSGAEQYQSTFKSAYRNNPGCLLIFDLSSSDSLTELIRRFKHLQNGHDPLFYDLCSFVLVGNKSDIEVSNSQGIDKQAQNFAKEIGAKYFKLSCLKREGIQQPFEYLAGVILQKVKNKVLDISVVNIKKDHKMMRTEVVRRESNPPTEFKLNTERHNEISENNRKGRGFFGRCFDGFLSFFSKKT